MLDAQIKKVLAVRHTPNGLDGNNLTKNESIKSISTWGNCEESSVSPYVVRVFVTIPIVQQFGLKHLYKVDALVPVFQ